MNRVRDYCGFAVWFLGFLTMTLWLVGSPERWMLPPALQAVGLAAAGFVVLRLLLLARRRRRARAANPPSTCTAEAVFKPQHQAPLRLPSVKPRRQFGLRDMHR
jgi:hypothetical protein